MHKPKILSIIPARGGSKGLPNKNIRNCAGKPLIAWSIEAALRSVYITKNIVSTDSPDIANIAKKFGADIPFMRPQLLATDDSSSDDVIKHAINWFNEHSSIKYDLIILLQPTSPLRNHHDIDQAIAYYYENKKTDTDTLISAYPVEKKYNLLMQRNNKLGEFCFNINKNNIRRQSQPTLFLPNGAIFIAPFEKFNGFYNDDTLIFEMKKSQSIDIDTEHDLKFATKSIITLD